MRISLSSLRSLALRHSLRCFVMIAGMATACATSAISQGATLLSDNFDGVTAGDLTSNNPWNQRESGTGSTIRVFADTGDLFGQGTTNQYLRMRDNGTGSQTQIGSTTATSPARGFGSHSFISASFNFIEPTNLSGESFTDPLIFKIKEPGTLNLINSGNTVFELEFDDGAIDGTSATYSLDTLHHVEVLFNSSASPIDYGAGVVAPNSADIWIDGVMAVEDVAGTGTALMGSLSFHTLNSERQLFLLDDVLISDEAIGPFATNNAVPEPASIAAWIITLALAMIGRRWQRRRR